MTYKIEEVSVELIVVLPEDYPLHPPTVREGKRIRVEASQWRKWMLQLHIFLTKQVLMESYSQFLCGKFRGIKSNPQL